MWDRWSFFFEFGDLGSRPATKSLLPKKDATKEPRETLYLLEEEEERKEL